MRTPKVSVVMSVYNGEPYLAQAMDSIVGQSYGNWECIVVNDCSTDKTAAILEACARRDSRIRIVCNDTNLGLAGSLNRAIDLADGDYIARMDGDDVCRLDRLEKQVAFMEKHPELSLSCCRYFAWKGENMIPVCLQRRGDAQAVRALFLFFEPILHPGVIARREAFAGFRYHEAYTCTEDLELWTRMLCAGKRLAVQDDYLMLYRLHDRQITATKKAAARKQYSKIIRAFYAKAVFPLSREQTDFLMRGIYFRDALNEKRYLEFIRQVRRANKRKRGFRQWAVEYAAFEVAMAYRSEFGLNGKQLFRLLSAFSPGFTAGEILRRKRAAKSARRDIEEAAAVFGLARLERGSRGQVPVYKKADKGRIKGKEI